MLSFHANVAPSAPAVLDVCWHGNYGFNPRAGKYLLLYADAAMANVTAADIPSTGVKKKKPPHDCLGIRKHQTGARTTLNWKRARLSSSSSSSSFSNDIKISLRKTADVSRRLNLPVHVVNLGEFNNL